MKLTKQELIEVLVNIRFEIDTNNGSKYICPNFKTNVYNLPRIDIDNNDHYQSTVSFNCSLRFKNWIIKHGIKLNNGPYDISDRWFNIDSKITFEKQKDYKIKELTKFITQLRKELRDYGNKKNGRYL